MKLDGEGRKRRCRDLGTTDDGEAVHARSCPSPSISLPPLAPFYTPPRPDHSQTQSLNPPNLLMLPLSKTCPTISSQACELGIGICTYAVPSDVVSLETVFRDRCALRVSKVNKSHVATSHGETQVWKTEKEYRHRQEQDGGTGHGGLISFDTSP